MEMMNEETKRNEYEWKVRKKQYAIMKSKCKNYHKNWEKGNKDDGRSNGQKALNIWKLFDLHTLK